MLRQVKPVLSEMGHLFQVQDDYLGCYGKSNVHGKDYTDIQEGKCTWLIVVALQCATPEQRKILEVNIVDLNVCVCVCVYVCVCVRVCVCVSITSLYSRTEFLKYLI